MMLEWVWHTAEQVAQEAEADQDYRFGKRIGQRERRWGLGKTDKK